jgi:2-methylcitrate dehydratase PrpD
MGDYLDQIARFAAETRLEDIPPDAVEAAKWILLDTLGGMLASSTLPEVQRFAALAAERGGQAVSTLVGFQQRADPLFAAMVNSTSACSYETDEGHRLGGGHPAIHVIPPSLAVAEAMHAGGRRLLETITIAYEVMSRLASGGQSRWPVHSHGTHGSPGAAAAVAHLRGYDAAAMRRTLNLAACMSPATTWKVCFEGGIVRNLFSAESCFLGMLAADLEPCGYSGAHDSPAEMYGQVLGQGSFDSERVVRGLGSDWRVTSNYFKQYASCRITHPPLDAMYAILKQRRLKADDIEAIEVYGPAMAQHLGYADPQNMLAAKFSIPFSLATAVVLGATGIESFEGAALEDPAVRALASRVTVREDPNMSHRVPGYPSARVAVRLRGEEALQAETFIASGDALNPLERSAIAGKFRSLAGRRCDAAMVDAVFDAVMAVDQLADISQLHALLCGA